MSRIGIHPVEIVDGVQVEIKESHAIIRGVNGEQTIVIPHGIKVLKTDKEITVVRVGESKHHKALHGTVRALLQNAVSGVTTMFEKKLELVGIGYRAALEGNILTLQVGFTHIVKMKIPDGLNVKIQKNIISVNGPDKQILGQFCADVRAVRKPEPYKGKGIRYVGEKVRMKQGKAIKAAE